jgi:hypothetical protein
MIGASFTTIGVLVTRRRPENPMVTTTALGHLQGDRQDQAPRKRARIETTRQTLKPKPSELLWELG